MDLNVLIFLFLLKLSGCSIITLYMEDTVSDNISPVCELSLQIKDGMYQTKLCEFGCNINIELDADINEKLHILIYMKKCNLYKIEKILVENKQYIIDSYCNYECCIFDVYNNKSKLCDTNYSNYGKNIRSLLSINTTNITPLSTENKFGKEFYGIPILAYFVLLFGIVCMVWVCCIIALCIGYKKRRKTIKAKGISIRKKSNNNNNNNNNENNNNVEIKLQNTNTNNESYESDNDIILQMEQDWASDNNTNNGTNIFDSALNTSNPNILINSNTGNTNSKTIPIIYAKTCGLNEFDINIKEEKQFPYNSSSSSSLDDYSSSSSALNNYKTNNKNPFKMQINKSNTTLTTNTTLTNDESIRFPNELMRFPSNGTKNENEKQIHIEIQEIEDQQTQQAPFSPVSITPQPISAPLSPPSMEKIMPPIKPLSTNKKSPFHLPPPSIQLTHIHSPNHTAQKPSHSLSKSKSKTQNKSHKAQITINKNNQRRYVLDQTDLFEKLSKIET